MTSTPDPRHEAYAGAITTHLPGNPERIDAATAAVMALADRDRQLAVWALQGLLTAFPADLTPGGPAVCSRLLPAGLVRRWQQSVCGQQAEPGRVMAAVALATLLGPIPDGVDSASQTAIRAIQLMNEAGQARGAAEARVRELEAALDRVRNLHRPQPDGSGFPDGQQCRTCSQGGGDGYQYLVPWPCPTIHALDADQPKEKS